METKGLKILDSYERCITVTLNDILDEIPYDKNLNWVILYLDGEGPLNKKNISTLDFMNKINDTKQGLPITRRELDTIFKNICIFDTAIIAAEDKNVLHRYKFDLEMYHTCDIVIEMFDSSWWIVYAKDRDLINQLSTKFKNVEFLD